MDPTGGRAPYGVPGDRPPLYGVGGSIRYWTEPQRRDLFQDHFDSVPLICPVCAEVISVRMVHTRDVVVLAAHCEGCNNRAVLFFGGLIGMPAEKVSHERTDY